jgi:hypothetical protein
VSDLLAQLKEMAESQGPAWKPVQGRDERPTGSKDLARVRDLPRREPLTAEEQEAAAVEMTARLGYENPNCVCGKLGSPCIKKLRPLQGWYLKEASNGGALGFIPVGGGKTGLDLLLPMVLPGVRLAVLLIRPQDAEQLRRDYAVWSQHFRTPNLAGGAGHFHPGRPTLEILPYSQLSRPEQTHYLASRKPDLIIADEAQALKDRKSARTGRFLRYYVTAKDTRFFAHSGSLTTRNLNDLCHLAALALREGSPLPLDTNEAERWSLATDPTIEGADEGALRSLAEGDETATHAIHRRIVETPGVVSTTDTSVDVKLTLEEAEVFLPESLKEHIRTALRGQRPDGEELTTDLEMAEVAMQLSCGFFYRWKFPRGEPEDLIYRWFEARKEWNRELRKKLERRVDGLDSPRLLRDAAERAAAGYKGPLPVWRSETLEAWAAVEKLVVPSPDVVWLDTYLAEACAAELARAPSICWYDFTEFGAMVAKLSGCPRFGGGPDGSAKLLNELKENQGTRSIVVSRNAHGTGKNMQAHNRMLFPTPPSDGGAWEQAIGRCHRYGQKRDVSVVTYQHTAAHKKAFDTATKFATYIQQISGNPQKLVYGERLFDGGGNFL